MSQEHELLPILRELHDLIRNRVVAACETQAMEELSRESEDTAADTIFAIDKIGESELINFLDCRAESVGAVVLIAEGLDDGAVALPRGTDPQRARWQLIVDPVDGTRCIMYQKRSAWILTGAAPNRGDDTRLSDIELAVQTEIPTIKQHLCDQFWAIRGQGVWGERLNRLDGSRSPLQPRPSQAATIRQGYAMTTRFFPGARDISAALDDEISRRVLGSPPPGKALTFEDQYPSTGGQIWGLFSGRDRFVADLRPLMNGILTDRGWPLGLCCHPYDICTALIAEQAGVHITGPAGGPLDGPLDVQTSIAWAGYANAAIRQQVEPVLLELLNERHLLGY